MDMKTLLKVQIIPGDEKYVDTFVFGFWDTGPKRTLVNIYNSHIPFHMIEKSDFIEWTVCHALKH